MKKLSIYLLISIMIVLFSGCIRKAGNVNDKNLILQDSDNVRIAFVTMTTTSPQPLINLSNEIFADVLSELGKNVELLPTRSLDNVYPLLDHDIDDPDFMYLPHSAFTTYITKTSKFGGSDKYVVIAGSMNLDDIQLVVRPEISSLDELDGKKVGIPNLRYSDDYQLNELLASVGLGTSSFGGTVEIVWDDIVVSLLDNYSEGKYDAVVLFNTDNVGQALDRVPGSQVFLLNPNPEEKYPRIWLIAKKALIKDNPNLVKTFLRAHVISTEEALKNIDELPALNRESFIGWFADKGADIAEKNPLEKFVERWQIVEITYDPNMAYTSGVFSYLQDNRLVEGLSIDDFIKTDLLVEVLEEMGKAPLK